MSTNNDVEVPLAVVPDDAPMTTRKKLKDFCHECGGCCHTFILNVHAGQEIADFVNFRVGPHYKGHDFEIFADTKTFRVRIVMNMGCLYLTKEGKCSVYDRRPKVCHEFWCDNVMRRFLTWGQLYGIETLDSDDLHVIPPRLLNEIPLVNPSPQENPVNEEKASNT